MAEEKVESTVVELLIKAVDELTEPVEHAEKSLRGLISDVKQAGASTIELFAGYEAMERVIEPAAAMQEKLTDLQIATGATAEQLLEFKEKAEEMSTHFGVNAEEMVAAQTRLAQTFGETEKALQASDTVAKYALVTHQNAISAAQGLASAYQTIGDKSKPFEEGLKDVADRLTFLQTKFNLSGLSAEAFGRMFANIAGQAQQFHLPMDQLEALAAVLSRTGYQGARAMMIVRESMNTVFGGEKGFGERWAKAGLWIGKDWDKNLINFIATVEHADKVQHAAFEHFVQTSGQTGIVLENLVKHLDQWKEATEGVDHAQGQLDNDAAKVAHNFNVVFADFKNALSNFADAIGTELLPKVTRLVIWLTDALTAIQKFSEEHPELMDVISGFVALVAALTTLAGLFGLVVGYLALVSTSLEVLGATFGGVILAIGVFAAVFGAFAYLIYANWHSIVHIWEWGTEQIHYFMLWWSRFVNDPWDVTKSTWESGKSWLSGMMDSIGDMLSFTRHHPLLALQAVWKGIKQGVLELSGFLGNLSLGSMISGEILALRFGGLWGAVAYNVILSIALIIENWSHFVDWFKTHLPEILKAVHSLTEKITHAFTAAAQAVKDAWQSVKQAFDDILGWIGNKVDWLGEKFNSLTDFLSNLTHFGGVFGDRTGVHNPPGVHPPELQPWAGGPRAVRPPSLYQPSAYMTGEGGMSFTHSPQVNVYMTGNGDAESVRAAVQQVLDDHKDEFAQQMQDYIENNRRTTFKDLMYT